MVVVVRKYSGTEVKLDGESCSSDQGDLALDMLEDNRFEILSSVDYVQNLCSLPD